MSSAPESGVLLATSEFVLKSSPVRRTLEQRLVDDLRTCLKIGGFEDFTIEKRSARILIRGVSDTATAASMVSGVFGVAYAAEVTIVPGTLTDVLGALTKHASESLGYGESFAVRCKRSDESPISRREVETKGGAEILSQLAERKVKVNLEKPDVLISVDLADGLGLIYEKRIRGPGGLPISSHWKMMAVLDSGPLSILAAYAMMRRGCLVELFIPVSKHIEAFSEEAQLGLATNLRRLVTRSQYYGYVLEVDRFVDGVNLSPATLKLVARMLGIRFAKKNRLKGIILADVSGKISSKQEDSGGLPVFQPLLGLTPAELYAMCDLARFPRERLRLELASGQCDVGSEELKQTLADDFHVDKVALGISA